MIDDKIFRTFLDFGILGSNMVSVIYDVKENNINESLDSKNIIIKDIFFYIHSTKINIESNLPSMIISDIKSMIKSHLLENKNHILIR